MIRRKRSRVLVVTMAVVAAASWYFWSAEDYPDIEEVNDLVVSRLQAIVSREGGSGCVMPQLDPFSEEAMRFSGPPDVEPLTCSGEDWVECRFNKCQVKPHIARRMKGLVCEYRDIIFVTDEHNTLAAPVAVRGTDRYTLVASDHVKVSCKGVDINQTSSLSLFASRWSGYTLGFRSVPRAPPDEPSALNVMVVVFDSTSRNGFIRRMPRSYQKLQDMGAVLMESHNIVLDGTPGALYPVLTGHSELELPDTRRMRSNKAFIDEKLLLFHVLKEQGYRTAYFEDWPWIATFTHRFNGFERSPADHYLRPLLAEESWKRWWLVGTMLGLIYTDYTLSTAAVENVPSVYRSAYLIVINNNLQAKAFNIRECIGDTPTVKLMMKATDQLHKMDGYKFSFTFFVAISHDDFHMITAVDGHLEEFLTSFQRQGRGKDTLLVLMGDHGQRFGSYRNTFQGKVEERLPLMAFVLPEKLKMARPNALKNLMANSKVLTTHYDMHSTLLDAMGLKEKRNTFKVPGAKLERGLSMLEPIPKSRTCAEAGIMPHWCACARWRPVSRSHALYRRVALALADYINSLVSEAATLCSHRRLQAIESVLQQSPDSAMLGYMYRKQADMYVGQYEQLKHAEASAPVQLFQAKIIVDPGNSVFEGTIYYNVKGDNFSISERDISRVNAYGNEPECLSLTHPHLNKYCYCKDQA